MGFPEENCHNGKAKRGTLNLYQFRSPYPET